MEAKEIVSCEWLNKQIEEGCKNLIILDVSWYSEKDGRQDYLREHIPGAIYLDIMKDVELTPLYPRNLPTTEVFQKNVRAVGVDSDSHVILYSDTNMCSFFLSGRTWWMFKYFGHDKVSILDGGWQKWIKDGYKKSFESPVVKEGNFIASVRPSFRKTVEEIRELSAQRSTQFVESRPYKAYSDGHIPGARNLPGVSIVDEEKGILKSREELSKLFQSSGIDLRKPVTMYCSGGMSSCTLVLAAGICGAKDVSLFPGGYTEWKQAVGPEQIEK